MIPIDHQVGDEDLFARMAAVDPGVVGVVGIHPDGWAVTFVSPEATWEEACALRELAHRRVERWCEHGPDPDGWRWFDELGMWAAAAGLAPELDPWLTEHPGT